MLPNRQKARGLGRRRSGALPAALRPAHSRRGGKTATSSTRTNTARSKPACSPPATRPSCSAATARCCATPPRRPKAELPVIGVNSGTLGYLTELEQNEIPQLAALCDGGLRIEERMMLESSLDGRIVDYALNEALISRGGAGCSNSRLDCDGTAAATYRADG